MSKPYEKETYFGLTMDPVHIGTGGYRLGRVDNTITREPGTNLPKVPGTGISGVARAFTAMAIQNTVDMKNPVEEKNGVLVLNMEIYNKMKYQRPVYKFVDENKYIVTCDTDRKPVIRLDNKGKEKYDSCAGKGGEKGDSHCGKPDCEVCVAYGFSKDGNSFQGMAQFFDARILFFPVYSMLGPVWITSESIMHEFDIAGATLTDKKKFKRFNVSPQIPEDKLNLGWLMLECEDGEVNLTDKFSYVPKEIKDRLILVSDKLFSRIVNDNLEVRTSVAIDPATGAAVDGALYTYEAIPRATVLWFDVVYNKPENFRINGKEIMKDETTKANWEWIKENVEKGLRLIEFMGVGGMNTRGMGRMRISGGGINGK
ncbi:MAG: type III-B CRISPR module RAMP protein Cmr4 [Proteobacteria bacterium]|nr:type III-B CRISPR module RAMP protein Cmr4 [Pseudomonadota bacterium]